MDDRLLLMIPGPIELEPEVQRALAARTKSHLDPEFVETFGGALERVREVFRAPSAQPLIVAGSGTIGMEIAASTLIEPGDPVLVVDTGFFSERMASLLGRIGAQVSRVGAEPGRSPEPAEIERALAGGSFRAVTITHVDTSTGVRAPAPEIATLARKAGALVILDAVCSVGGEALEHDAWGIDCTLSASQKALGGPPGLCVLAFSERAIERARARRKPPTSLYLDALEWIPIMQAYEARKPAYFATPAVNLVRALDASLALLCAEGIDARVARHARMARAVRAGLELGLGLRIVAEQSVASSTITGVFYPDGVDGSLVARVRDEGVVIAGGLHPAIRARSFRVGHMGAVSSNDVIATIAAIERALAKMGAKVELGAGVHASQRALL